MFFPATTEMDFILIDDRELALDSEGSLPLESLKAHFGPNAKSLNYLTDEGRECCKYTLINISVHDLFL